MTRFSELMAGQTLLPIIQADTPEQGVQIAKAMANAGLTLVEVVLRTEASIEALKAIKAQVPELKVGAGTVINTDILEQALEAGSDFIVTPAVSPALLEALAKCNVPVLPGVSNTGDILMALEYGFEEQKLFPASLAGGAPFVSAVSSVFRAVSFCPTGGVSESNKMDYLSLNNVFAVGGTWIAKKEWVEQENWQAITDSCIQALK
ncbi:MULTISPECIES: bifunctional 4-hydroxy-2-oxoglutarate aldolase/2-dehydro-3-deoxy-phosphogluconate aldolase [Pseudoalteromonas]|jgi:2-dehydro-3-deoxyphosphogluconate aldolase/(4S)-4-hydroxy-2-oxoglutarate aldolase|uniref:Bifunctional 4-hydroxy-2-oxoglutarate aldolase/2-dehydro-3-deoxy-phosphogluconate aldolase n=2 Tax=Pseudoalteromonas TaxID=53246 RepID=F3BNN6_9GAMM|nr:MULTISPECIES: bifunctional 4-hydroxy-2-oxoglutarate aldolase/2-dehydro-3-deoxy-phosphogluconate aldolase [Pseudoalteromonas]EGI71757.1 4-hydroxy-2-oxoglutarate aldolase / 2-dehydro-3-deoxyphosphogluconate aldolase [Pseudoalteromonas distincta]KAA1161820.1 bifunctional 4-hydroxy-2-oxoglutarate aldolase/2-dehydro-3-deoxy-phosphogluconate aldolase [Pseudoalteromonas distincta]KHM50847.1 keto-deoxy-phosphogluconate aldolase [Pseudoalteromonas elyakovii]KID35123.1 keto-deoxy-phosphogluconate aldo|tara:strand:- start:23608 stop:24225 length:618 start_codon:yes stop_codon:yes gene_type:complete